MYILSLIGLSVDFLAIIFVATNILAIIIARVFPSFVQTPEEKLRFDYMARFESTLAPYRAGWFDIKESDWDSFSNEYRRHELNIYEYDSFCEYKHPARVGQFINYSEHGFRCGAHQAVWPPISEQYTIFFFGGSTTLGVGPDWTTVPSHLQTILRARLDNEAAGRPIAVYNFGRGAYFSSLEMALFQNLFVKGFDVT